MLHFAIIVSIIAIIVLGMLWYSKALFGKTWLANCGLTEKQLEEEKNKGMVGTFVTSIFLNLIMVSVLYILIIISTVDAYLLSILLWIGFIVPVIANSSLWEKRSWKIFWINIGYQLVSLLLVSLILSLFGVV